MYTYQKQYNDIFDTATGRKTLEAVQQAVEMFAGQFTSGDIINKACDIVGSVCTDNVLNSLDHLVTLGELRELTNRDEVFGQRRLYVRQL